MIKPFSALKIFLHIRCREQILNAVHTQRDYFEMAVGRRAKAKECCDLVILAIYIYLPPSRGLEIRTLQILEDDTTEVSPWNFKKKNVISLKSSGQISLHFYNYKTHKFFCGDELTLGVSETALLLLM